MSRVWKRTLYKVGYFFLMVTTPTVYVLACAAVSYYLFNDPGYGLFGSLIIGLFFVGIYGAYKDAKREIDYENEEIMRQLKMNEGPKKR